MIYISGDMHGENDKAKFNTKNFPDQKSLTKNDYVIITGDFGCIWDNSSQQKWLLNWLTQKNFTTLFVDGNHENFDLLYQYPVEEWKGGKIHRITDSIYHLMRGQVFTIENKKFFTFGGATSVDKAFRKEFISWWAQEVPNYQEINEGLTNLSQHNNTVDYVLSHTAPSFITEQLASCRLDDPVCKILDAFHEQISFIKWFFGHFHVNRHIGDNFFCLYNKVIKLA